MPRPALPMTPRPRVLIFVVAYEAETTLHAVLARIPSTVFELFDAEVLVIDDASRDATFEVGLRSQASSPHPTTILYNPRNQGYGGNQKLGYHYAIRHGFDHVVLLHGDGQYAPESLPNLLEPLVSGTADAVMGSRMLSPGGARRGGMPLYKFIGNKILTLAQNRLLGSRLSEFHSGYRAYRVATLAKIPFEANANVFHFDTEILIQLMLAGARIVEVPIPTYYGDEICRVDGMVYAKDVMAATLASRMHRLGVFYDRRFDLAFDSNVHYDLKLGYTSSHTLALAAIQPGERVLDIGCGPGDLDREFVRKGCRVTGVDQYAPVAPSPFERFLQWNETAPFPAVDLADYDTVLLLDILEHLRRPEALLRALRSSVGDPSHAPRFLVTTPNIAFFLVRLQVLLGNFNYGKSGILDLTHTRLFTFRSLARLFSQAGYAIEKVAGIPAPYPKAIGMGFVARALLAINSVLIRLSKGLFAYQILLVARPLPEVEALLDHSIAASVERRDRAAI
jgi:glycosyltransferase involved in cell wall biosynthesis